MVLWFDGSSCEKWRKTQWPEFLLKTHSCKEPPNTHIIIISDTNRSLSACPPAFATDTHTHTHVHGHMRTREACAQAAWVAAGPHSLHIPGRHLVTKGQPCRARFECTANWSRRCEGPEGGLWWGVQRVRARGRKYKWQRTRSVNLWRCVDACCRWVLCVFGAWFTTVSPERDYCAGTLCLRQYMRVQRAHSSSVSWRGFGGGGHGMPVCTTRAAI